MKSAKFSTEKVDIFTTTPGAEVRIGIYGLATNTAPCVVPAEVAAEFAGREGFRVGASDDEPEKKKARKGRES